MKVNVEAEAETLVMKPKPSAKEMHYKHKALVDHEAEAFENHEAEAGARARLPKNLGSQRRSLDPKKAGFVKPKPSPKPASAHACNKYCFLPSHCIKGLIVLTHGQNR